MPMNPIIVIGGGGHAKVVVSILKRLPHFWIVGYVDKEDKGTLLGIPCVGNDSKLAVIKKKYPSCAAVLGIGFLGVSNNRRSLFEKLKSLGYFLPNIVSPQALVSEEVTIAEGTVVIDGAIIHSGSIVGSGVIINTSAVVDHDCRVDNFTHIAPGAVLNGGVEIGEECIIGANATVVQYKKIISHCIVGAGSVVAKDLDKSGTYVGVPCKKV